MLVLAIFLIAYIFSQFYRTSLAVITTDLVRDLGLDPAQLGALTAIWFVTFSAAQFPVGYLLDKHGPRRTCSIMMLLAVLGAIVFSQATGYWSALTGMGLVGLGCAPILMSALYYFGRKAPPERFFFYTSILVGIGSLGNLMGARPLSQSVAMIGWRASMFAIALMTLISAVSVYFTVDDPPKLDNGGRRSSALADLWQIICLRPVWPCYALTFVSYAVIAAERGLWIGPFLEEVHGFDALTRGNAAFWMALGMALGALAATPLVPLLGNMKRVAALGSLGAGSCFLILALATDMGGTATVIVLTLAGFFGMGYGVIMSHSRLFFPEHLLGRGVTFVNFLSIGGAGIALTLSGLWVRGVKAAGQPPAEIYATLHLSFGLILLVMMAYYLTAPAWPEGRNPKKPSA